MTKPGFDCVIVGARCAGAPLATHLAEGGMKVCLLDSDKLPSDQPFSTHAIAACGMDYLDELGVGARIRAITPPVHAYGLTVGSVHVRLPLSPGREMYCPRRVTLDPLLAERAVLAGAALRDETAVTDVLRDKGRVVGVRVRHRGVTEDIPARFVVGADGRNSTIARSVEALEYHAETGARGVYWGYWPLTPEIAKRPFGAYVEIQGTRACFFFRTDAELVVAGALDTPSQVRGWSKNIERHVTERLAASEVLRGLVTGNAPASPFVGLVRTKLFFRTPVGRGWALVGDAGLHKDPTPGYGITDALRDAKALAMAILDGRPEALDVYWRQRDVASTPLFSFAKYMGSPEYDSPLNALVLGKIASTPELLARACAAVQREISPWDMVPPSRVLAWAASAMARGHFEILPSLMASGRREAVVRGETAFRVALLAVAQRRLDHAAARVT